MRHDTHRLLTVALAGLAAVAAASLSCGQAPGPEHEGGSDSIVLDLRERIGDARTLLQGPLIEFGDARYRPHLLRGWSHDEEWSAGETWVWATSTLAELELVLSPEEAETARILEARCVPFENSGSPQQRVAISLNGRVIENFSLPGGASTPRLTLPPDVLRPGRNLLRFEFRYAEPLPESPHDRRHAVAFDYLRLVANAEREGTARIDGARPVAGPSAKGSTLLQALGTALVYHVPIPRNAVFSSGLEARGIPESGGIQINIRAQDGTERVLFAAEPHEIPAGKQISVNLAEYEGQTVDLVLASFRGLETGAQSVTWSAPRVSGTASERTNEASPNVLLITLDTTRVDYVGAYGSSAGTPSIDALADSGVRFTRNIATSQTTHPSHASILTGLYPARHAVYDNETPLPEAALTLPEILREHGYRTLGAVSVRHLNHGHARLGQGFDVFLDSLPIELSASARNDSLLVQLEALAKMGPFFAWVHYYDPHGDYHPPTAFVDFQPRTEDFEPIRGNSRMDIRWGDDGFVDPDEAIRLYKGEISYVDHEIGRLLQAIDRLGVRENTLVVLTADHGESLMEHGILFTHAGLFDEVARVPLILSWPGRLPSGTRIDATTSSVDIVPTILELLEVDAPASIDGVSLLPTLSDSGREIHDFVVSEAVQGVIRAIYMDGYKYIKPYADDWSMPHPRLHRWGPADSESQNLFEEEPEIANRLDARLEAWLAGARRVALHSERPATLSPDIREALAALGYIEEARESQDRSRAAER